MERKSSIQVTAELISEYAATCAEEFAKVVGSAEFKKGFVSAVVAFSETSTGKPLMEHPMVESVTTAVARRRAAENMAARIEAKKAERAPKGAAIRKK